MPCHSRGIGKRETQLLKFAAIRPYPDPEKASRRLMEHAQAFETVQDGGIYIEKINGPLSVQRQGNARGIHRRP